MCGIVGYIGTKSAQEYVLAGLQALEYRGYDSAGIACIDKDNGLLIKQVGRVEVLKNEVESQKVKTQNAIGHTRWATHGSPSTANAHPHTNTDKTIFVVHNGIIENYIDIKTKLESKGYKFVSETDTEVIPHLIDYYYKGRRKFDEAFQLALQDLQGAFAIAATTTNEPDKIYVAKLSSPLVIGVGKDEHILASDPTAIMDHTKQVIFLED